MNKTSSSGFGKTSKSKGAKPFKNNYVGRGEMIEPDKYYTVFEENTSLKKKVHQLEQDNKILSTKLQYNKIQNPIKEETKSEFKIDSRTLQIENENLRVKNKRLNEKVQSLEKYLKQAKPKSYNNLQNYNSSGKNYPNIYQKKDYEEVISRLRQTLKNYRENYDKLSNELSSLREGGASKAIIDYSNDIRDKNFKLSELSLEFDKLKEKYEANLKILEITKKTYEEYAEKYTFERNKNIALQDELQKQKSALEQMDEYANRIKEYEKNEKLLENKIMDLCENPFIKQINERDNTFSTLRETQMALAEAQTQLKLNHDKIMELNRQLNELDHKYEKVKLERDQFKEEAMRYKIDKEEREKQGKEFDAIFSRISQFGEVDSNYEKLMNLLKGQLSKDSQGKNWENIDFLEKMDEFPDSKDELKKEIQRLRREKGILGEELEKTKTLLSVIQQLNDDMKKKQDLDSKAYVKQINSLKDKLRRLTELVDRRNLPADFDLNSIYKKDAVPQKTVKEEIKYENEKDIDRNNTELVNRSIYTSITGFSKDSEEDFTVDENCLDLYITSANYDVESVQNKLGLQIDDLKSFISVDFYLHPTQISDMMTGKKPNYNLQLSFKVTVDENFIIFLQDESILIELYQLKNNTQIIFARGKIPLNQLIIIENDLKTRVVKGYIEMFYIDDSSIKICDIKYKMRMRKSILDKIKWIEEKNQIFKELDPINEANRKIMGELNINQPLTNIMAYYDKDNINNKVYNVKIIINKGEKLQKLGPIAKIQPYLYYRFYKQNEHFSNILSGPDPLFNDIEEYTCIYTGNFHEYLNKESLNIYIFDGSNPIKVDTDGNEVEMVRSDANSDLIGICKVTLRGLILNYKIEGKFPVLNEEGNVNLGYLEVNIIMEEFLLDDDDKKIKNEFDSKNIEGVDPILIKLAKVLRDKGLNMNSAFKLFDKDNEDLISLENFKSVVFFALKFISKEEDLKRLVDVVFKNKVVLDKQDFYQIFNNLLPLDDQFYLNRKTQVLGENTEISFNVIDKQNNNINKNEVNNYNTTGALNQINPNMTQNNNYTNYNKNNNIFNSSNTNTFNKTGAAGKRRSRSLNEIMLQVDDFMIYFGKRTASDLFKIFDQDANLKVGKKELANGFAKMQIALNPEELEMIWKKIVVSNNKENFGIEEFMVFYEKYKTTYKRGQ